MYLPKNPPPPQVVELQELLVERLCDNLEYYGFDEEAVEEVISDVLYEFD